MSALLRLKELAVNPSNSVSSYDSISQLCDQILEFRTALSSSSTETPWRKRKHERIIRGRLEAAAVFRTDMLDPKHISKTDGGGFSESYLLSSIDPVDDLYGQHEPASQNSGSLLTHENNDFSSRAMDSDGSENGADTLNSCTEKVSEKKAASSTDIEESVLSSASTCLERRGCTGSFHVKVVPIGPRFQVEIPPWKLPPEEHDLCDMRWLGSKVWPVDSSAIKTAEKYIGQGMDGSCCCSCRGSLQCVRKHTMEEAKKLEYELGEAFFGWRVHEMGDSVLKYWTAKEENRFVWFMKKCVGYGWEERRFWNGVLRAFPTKSKENLLSYYFGVFIPRMNKAAQAQSSGKHVDSDGDEVDEMGGRCKGQYSKYMMNHHFCLPG